MVNQNIKMHLYASVQKVNFVIDVDHGISCPSWHFSKNTQLKSCSYNKFTAKTIHFYCVMPVWEAATLFQRNKPNGLWSHCQWVRAHSPQPWCRTRQYPHKLVSNRRNCQLLQNRNSCHFVMSLRMTVHSIPNFTRSKHTCMRDVQKVALLYT